MKSGVSATFGEFLHGAQSAVMALAVSWPSRPVSDQQLATTDDECRLER